MIVRPTPVRNATVLTGWLAPNGDFYPCAVAHHYATAEDIIQTLQLESRDDEAYAVLYHHRFVHISYCCKCDMGWMSSRSPSQSQIDTLFDLWCKSTNNDEKKNLMNWMHVGDH